jgi:hypothetical protein
MLSDDFGVAKMVVVETALPPDKTFPDKSEEDVYV